MCDMATTRGELGDKLSSLSLFADLSAAELESIAHIVDERRFADGERILRQGLTGSGFYIILAGEGIIRIALVVRGSVPGVDAETFAAKADEAKVGCPVSKALAGVPEITLEAKLTG